MSGAPETGLARLDRALALICDALGAPLGKILELDQSGSSFVVRAGIGWRDGVAGHATVSAAVTSTAGYALAQPQAVIFDDVQRTSRFTDAALLRSHDVIGSLAVRIKGRERPRGVLSMHDHGRRKFTAQDAAFLEAAALLVLELM